MNFSKNKVICKCIWPSDMDRWIGAPWWEREREKESKRTKYCVRFQFLLSPVFQSVPYVWPHVGFGVVWKGLKSTWSDKMALSTEHKDENRRRKKNATTRKHNLHEWQMREREKAKSNGRNKNRKKVFRVALKWFNTMQKQPLQSSQRERWLVKTQRKKKQQNGKLYHKTILKVSLRVSFLWFFCYCNGFMRER